MTDAKLTRLPGEVWRGEVVEFLGAVTDAYTGIVCKTRGTEHETWAMHEGRAALVTTEPRRGHILAAWARDAAARAVSAERDRRVLLALRDHLLQHPEAKAIVHAYVVERWKAAELSEGMAAFLLGVDRLQAREIADGINAATEERARKLAPVETYAERQERRRLAWAKFDTENPDLVGKRCHADRDGDCVWPTCPQNRDGEPKKSGRHCPLDRDEDE